MQLHTLTKSKGLHEKKGRVGRGNGSWRGNYSTKGHKWQNARSWGGVRAGFEWGQTSIFMRIPKRKGFKRHFKLVEAVAVVNLWALNKDEKITKTVNKEILKQNGHVKSETLAVKVLGNGDRDKAATFEGIEYFSQSAVDKIAKAGGKIVASKKTKTDKSAVVENSTEQTAE